jgi:hypothetical protein
MMAPSTQSKATLPEASQARIREERPGAAGALGLTWRTPLQKQSFHNFARSTTDPGIAATEKFFSPIKFYRPVN